MQLEVGKHLFTNLSFHLTKLVKYTCIYCCHSYRPTELARREQSCEKNVPFGWSVCRHIACCLVGIITDLLMQLEEVSKHAYTSTMPTHYSATWSPHVFFRKAIFPEGSSFWPINAVEFTRWRDLFFSIVDILKTEKGSLKDSLQT